MRSSGSVHRWGDLLEQSPVDEAATGTGWDKTGIYSAMVRATGRTVVFESRAHLVFEYENITPAIVRRG